MIEVITEALADSVIDTVKLFPFFLLTYLIMEYIERKTEEGSVEMLGKAGGFAPLFGAGVGAVPQCGFSAAAASLYSGGLISIGTLMAVFLSTSDEMLPIFLSAHVPAETIAKVMISKVVIAVISGFFVELLFGWLAKRRHVPEGFSDEPAESCNCAAGLLVDSIVKTLQVFVFILIVSMIIGIAMELAGASAIKSLFHGLPIVGEMVAGLVGLIPNCAASVVITQLYLEGVINAGTMMSGLLSSAGVGLLVLCRENHRARQSVSVIALLYVISVFWGILINAFGITF